MRKKSEVPELNKAKLGLVRLRLGCWSNFNIVVKSLARKGQRSKFV